MSYVDYGYVNAGQQCQDSYVWPRVEKLIRDLHLSGRAFDLGCGNGASAAELKKMGFSVAAVDPSRSGISVARRSYPDIQFEVADGTDSLAARFGTFDLVISIEVVEHCYDPAALMRTLASLLKPGGVAIVSTPYHGYLKNLALAALNKWDAHMPPLWLGGHIKMFSQATFTKLLRDGGLRDIQLYRVGRIPPFAKSMIGVARR